MKKVFVILQALLLVLTFGCTNASDAPHTDARLVPEDFSQASLRDYCAETADGYYYQNGEFIYFSPRGSHAFYPLCSKPNCDHSDENCNAWCGSAFGYYDGSLYAVSMNNNNGQVELIKMNPDGSDHTVVTPLQLGQDGAAFQAQFHHGKLYIYTSANALLPIDEQKDHLFVLNLQDLTQTACFPDFFDAGGRFSFIDFFEDKLYVYAQKDRNPDSAIGVMEFDVASGTYRELVPLELGIVYATETTFYYLEPDVGFREYDLATGEIKDCGLPVEDAWWAAYDEDYIYLMGHGRKDEYTLYFLSRDYVLLDQIELTDGIYYNYAASDRLYFSKDFDALTHSINKSDIGSHELALKPLDGN